MSNTIVHRTISFIFVLAIVSSFAFIEIDKEVASASTITVPDQYLKIKYAVENASAGDTILVGPGEYKEELVMDKTLTIRSSSGDPADTIIEGNGKDVFIVEANDVEINGFTIKSGYHGIIQKNSNGCTYKNNIISYNIFGLNIIGDLQTTLTENTIQNNHIHHSYQDALTLEYTSKNVIRGNTIESNSHGGISVYYSDENLMEDNSLSSQAFGFHLRGSKNNVIDDNYIYDTSKGVYLEVGSNYNIIVNNTIIKSYLSGIYLATWSNSNDIYNNIVIGSEFDEGITLYSCELNRIYRNDFIDNDKDAFDDGDNIWWKPYPTGGNYWSNHTGVDEMSGPFKDQPGSDGFIDESYHIAGGDNIDIFPLVEPYNELENSRPVAYFTIDPEVGNTTTRYVFDALESYDEEDDISDLQFRWDWTYDGEYDTPWSILARTTKKFFEPGTYEVRLEVKDTGGLTNTFVQEVTVYGEMSEPSNFECRPADSVILLSWSEPESDGGDEVIGYKIYKGTSVDTLELFKTVDHRTFNYRDTQVDNGVTYYYKINAFSEYQQGKKTGLCGTTPRESNLVADFTWKPFYPKEGDLTCLKDLSSEGKFEIINWTFDIDNGRYILYKEGCVLLEAGVYLVNLTVSDGITSDSITKDIVVADDISFDIGPGQIDISPDWDYNITISIELESSTQFVISDFSKNPANATLTGNILQIGNCFGVEVNNSDAVNWPITIKIYYEEKEINESKVDENTLSIYYWDEENQEWSQVEEYSVNTTNQNRYSGYVECKLDHLTIFTLGGRNPPPHAVCPGDISCSIGELVTFHGTFSTDDIGIVNYTWEFEYEGKIQTLYGKVFEFVFEREGTYEIKLTVMDEHNNTSSDTFYVYVVEKENMHFYYIMILAAISVGVLIVVFIVRKMKKI
ncbi:MAG: NosD domain-containing protein [Candidatus Saliniplasma sp.]